MNFQRPLYYTGLFLILITLLLKLHSFHFFLNSEQEEPPGQYLKIDNQAVYYEETGTGEPIIFVHGIGASSSIWKDTAKHLPEGQYYKLLMDLPGFGHSAPGFKKFDLDSQSKRLHQIISQFSVKKPLLVCSSMGAALCLWLAKNHPQTYEKIIAIAPAVSHELTPVPKTHLLAPLSYLANWFINKFSIQISIGKVINDRTLITDKRVADSLRHYLSHNILKNIILATETINDPRLPNELVSLQAKVLLIWGEEEEIVPKKIVTSLSKIINKSHFISLENGGHHLMESHPEWLSQQIIKFNSYFLD